MIINTVKLLEKGFLVNGKVNVPLEGHDFSKMIKEWLVFNTPEPSKTQETFVEIKREQIKEDSKTSLRKGFTTSTNIKYDLDMDSIAKLKLVYDIGSLSIETTVVIRDYIKYSGRR